MKKIFLTSILFFPIFLFSCTLEPKYETPKSNVPLIKNAKDVDKITSINWKIFFQSQDLQRVIQLALDNNQDLKIANLNIDAAQNTYGIARSALIPQANITASQTRQEAPKSFFAPKRQYRAGIGLSAYELDLFGRVRSLKKSSLESFLASQKAQKVVKISLIAETANAYAQYLVDQEIIEIQQEIKDMQQQKYKFMELKHKNGLISDADLSNAKAVLESYFISYENYKKMFAQSKNLLMSITGIFEKDSLPQIKTINEIKINQTSLDLIPSESLLNRPDIQEAEHNLKSANANIGAARAAFFPSITLTASYGYGSKDLNSLFGSKTWSFSPQINLPIFSQFSNYHNLKFAEARKKIEVANYEKAIQTAFREVLDQSSEREALTNQLISADNILIARTKNFNSSKAKLEKGLNSKFDYIEDKILFLLAKQEEISIKKEHIANMIVLYKVLGGGSEVE
jgi:multidrug efflux system outer membrane protein